jgi:hypothetical protein
MATQHAIEAFWVIFVTNNINWLTMTQSLQKMSLIIQKRDDPGAPNCIKVSTL